VTDDDLAAIYGEAEGYVPCGDEPADPPAEDDAAAITGSGEGYVAVGAQAGEQPVEDDSAAISGYAEGYVAAPCGCTAGISDGFDRVVALGWGTADFGTAWRIHHDNPVNSFSVDGTEAVAVMDPVAGGEDFILDGIEIPLDIDDVISGTFDFNLADIPASPYGIVALEFRGGDLNFQLFISSDAAFGKLQLVGFGDNVALVVKTDWQPSTWYRVRFLYDHANDIQALKVWPRDESEPGPWDLQRTTSIDTYRTVDPSFILLTLYPGGVEVGTMMIDCLAIDQLPVP
jgi:hypothetical protein